MRKSVDHSQFISTFVCAHDVICRRNLLMHRLLLHVHLLPFLLWVSGVSFIEAEAFVDW